MKREVASSLVERGVAERVRLTQAYEKKRTDLQKQHDNVRAALAEHRNKVKSKYKSLIVNCMCVCVCVLINSKSVTIFVLGDGVTWKRSRITNMHFVRWYIDTI